MFKKIVKDTLIISTIMAFIFCIIEETFSNFFGCILGFSIYAFIPVLIYNHIKDNKQNMKSSSENKDLKNEEAKEEIVENKEYRKKCNVCGNIFCYTDKDVQVSNSYAELTNLNRNMASRSVRNSMLGIGSMHDPDEKLKLAEMYSNKVIDYSKCPKCSSSDLSDVLENTKDSNNITNETRSNLDELEQLEKLKELLDKNIITKQEFNAKKRQILKLDKEGN